MFEQFSKSDKVTWQTQVSKDLKGKPFGELIWQLEPDLAIEPFYMRSDLAKASVPLGESQGNDWAICESINGDDYKAANKIALEALMGGASALEFELNRGVSATELAELLADITLPYIHTHFFYTGKKMHVIQKKLEHFYHLAKAKGYDTAELSGSLHTAPLGHAPNWKSVATLATWMKANLPKFRTITINEAIFHTEDATTSEALAKTMARANATMQGLMEQGWTAEAANEVLSFQISIGKSYFLNIAKIRALKLLWLNICQGYGIQVTKMPPIKAIFQTLDYDDNVNTNMIRASTMALSAAIGGVDTLTVLPADKCGDSALIRRIARNVQHLLKMESYVDKVADPAAGAYYIEHLTQELAAKAWAIFEQQQLA